MLIKKFIFNAKYCTAGRPQLLDPRTSDASIVNSTSLLDERKLTLNFCAEAHCDYFSPTVFLACYCCPDVSRKEYCHLKLEDCRAACATCKPKCSWKLYILVTRWWKVDHLEVWSIIKMKMKIAPTSYSYENELTTSCKKITVMGVTDATQTLISSVDCPLHVLKVNCTKQKWEY